MSTEDFVKYMTIAKGIFQSKYNISVSNIQVIENTDEIIKFKVEGISNNSEPTKELIISFNNLGNC